MSRFVYHEKYNVRFAGLEKLHPFDSCKYEKISKALTKLGVDFAKPEEVTEEKLLVVHTKKYLKNLENSSVVAKLCEMSFLKIVPNFLLQKFILTPMRYQVAGTILAGEIAMDKGWSVNLGGGMHHASSNLGGGWCIYSDIPLSIKNLMEKKIIDNAMIIDLDVHQGNGHETDVRKGILDSERIFIIDAYNPNLYPMDKRARKFIDTEILIDEKTTDETYLSEVKNALEESLTRINPCIVYYNAGTDILENNPLNGGVCITEKGVIERDELVMNFFISRKIPIVMVLSGGYSQASARVISKSLENLLKFN